MIYPATGFATTSLADYVWNCADSDTSITWNKPCTNNITITYPSNSSKTNITKAYIEQQSKSIQYKLECDSYEGWNTSSNGLYGTVVGAQYNWNSSGQVHCPPKPGARLRAMIQARQAPLIIATRKPLACKVDKREQRARDTLRRLVGDDQYRRFLAHGFITVRPKSGKVYQIRPGHGVTAVYSSTGEPIERLCVVLRGNFPPTDEAITRYLMILNNEDHFRSLAVVSSPLKARTEPTLPDQRPLPEIFAMFKRQAA